MSNLNLQYKYRPFFPKNFFLKVKEWKNFFCKRYKSDPSFLQFFWAKKYFLGESFSLLAPTGIGKTTFGLSLALFEAKQNKKSYIILPTRLLVEQVNAKLLSLGAEENEVLAYDGKNKKDFEERLGKGEFKILITTSMYLYKNVEKLKNYKFSFIFIDDVDSFLKSGRNVDKALYLLGFTEKQVNFALSVIRLKSKPKKTEQDFKRIEKMEKILEKIKRRRTGNLIVSSATSNPRSSRIKLFRELLDFEVGRAVFYLRNILDAYTEEYSEENLLNFIRILGKGGLIFLPEDKGIKGVQELEKFLKEKGVKVESYLEGSLDVLQKFEKGEIDCLLGIASYKNPLARGIDLPFAVRYSLFFGVPKMKFSLKTTVEEIDEEEGSTSSYSVQKTTISPRALFWLILIVRQKILKKDKILADELQKILEKFQISLTTGKVEPEVLEKAKEIIFSEKFLKVLEEDDEISVKKEEDRLEIYIADITGYLQASGRASRFTTSGLTFGFSLIFVDDKKVFRNLIRKLYWYGQEFEFVPLEKVNLKEVINKIEQTRKRRFKEKSLQKEMLKPVLVVVESPNKARTIANFFGKPIRRKILKSSALEVPTGKYYLILTASLGHIFDLVKQGGFHGVKVNDEIKPVYEVIEGKEELVRALQKVGCEVEEVFVATDPDREGEKIGWDLKELFSKEGLKVRRAEFHEITKRAFEEALSNLREFDENLVKAQIVRRIADRWVGFEFSQRLQKKFGYKTLSAGRVQTPVLGWIIQRAEESKKKIWEVKIKALQSLEGEIIPFEITFDFEDEGSAREFFENLKEVEIEVLEEKEKEIFPPAPFSTDVMLKEASQETGWSLPFLMSLAQDLFEAGLITYHRTDSTTVSTQGMKIAKEYIEREFVKEYFSPRSYKKEGAHECIRPTKPIDEEELASLIFSGQYPNLKKEHVKLYGIIFRRFIASQMKTAKVRSQKLKIRSQGVEKEVEIVSKILEKGFLQADPSFPIKEIEISQGNYKVLPENKEIASLPKIYPFTHASLVFEMKKRGIGRPSTYAVIVEKLFERKYVYSKGRFIYPTEFGIKVYNYLQSLPLSDSFLKDEFTKQLEEEMDRVEKGEEDWEKILWKVYKKLSFFTHQNEQI